MPEFSQTPRQDQRSCQRLKIVEPGPLPVRHRETEGLIEFRTKQVNEALRKLLDTGAPLGGLRIRSQTLEDLFLALTGRELRDS